MSDITKLEAFKRILDARNELAKNRWEVNERLMVKNASHGAVKATIESNTHILNKWNSELKFIVDKKDQLGCLLAESQSSGNCHVPFTDFQYIIDFFVKLINVTNKTEIVSKMNIKECLSNIKILLHQNFERVTQDTTFDFKRYSEIMKLIESSSLSRGS